MDDTCFKCVVDRITFQNPENGYSVLRTTVEGNPEQVTIVGNFPGIHVGAVLEVTGDWKMDSRYGRQFLVQSWHETLPGTLEGIERYLGSGLIKGVGRTYAKRIVSYFGSDTLSVLESKPERLIEVPGLGAKRVEKILKSWDHQREINDLMIFLQSYGISTAIAVKIYRTYGSGSLQTVKENPYRLADDIWGIGFRTADLLARNMGIGKENFLRIRSGILYTMKELSTEGHVFALRDQLTEKGIHLLEVQADPLSAVVDRMLTDNELYLDEDAIYLPAFYHAEKGAAERLLKLAALSPVTISEATVQRALQDSDVHYDQVQENAIRTAAVSKVMVLTGGPGTGKTTTTQGIIALYRACNMDVLLAAPTGRAAKRMTETTGMEAKTIHRLLEYTPQKGYQRTDDNPLEGDALIVDECSMIDILLFNSLVRALPLNMHLVLVGDVDQLPSVGPGNVLRDIIDSGRFPVVRLQRIFRQAQNSQIIMNAHRVNQGMEPDLTRRKNSDFFFLTAEDPVEVTNTIVDLVKNRLPKTYQVKPSVIQVLTPMRKGEAGSYNLNARLQEALNPGDEEIRVGDTRFRLYDKVMQIRNNYDKDVFNGDIGRITKVDKSENTLLVTFDGRAVFYDQIDLNELVHAYATTIHKSQGSEYPIVVIPIHTTHFVMLQRNLLYTAITRAKRLLVLVGTRKALSICVNNQTVTRRNSRLVHRLRNGG